MCVTEQAQWISSQQHTPVTTRIVSGAEVLHTAAFTPENGWVRHDTLGALTVDIDYYIEGVQYYPTLYSGDKRFTTVSSFGNALEKLDRQGATVTVLVQGEALTEEQDAHAYQCCGQDGRAGAYPSAVSQDEEAYGIPPADLGLSPVYIPAGTPVAWLEPEVRQTKEVQQMYQH